MHANYSAPSIVRSGRRSLPASLLPLTLLVELLALPGCHNTPDDFSAPTAFTMQSDALPADVPSASPLFAVTFVPTPPNPSQVIHSPLPPEPSDPDAVANQAVQPDTPTTSTVVSEKGNTIPADVGLLVCDPVVPPSSPSSLANFSTGCGHWLHLMAAGQPEFGRTALWASRARIMHETGRTDLRLTPADIAPLAQMAGITHVACGTISGTPAHCTLSYTLYGLPRRLPLGPPLAQTGTLPQIVAALPKMAQTLDARLGLSHILAAPPAPAADDLARLGADAQGRSLSDAELLYLAQMSARSPLAGILLLQTDAISDQLVLNKTVQTLLTKQPQNSLVLSEIGYYAPGALRPYAAQTSSLFHRFPQSALLAHTQVWEQRVWGSRSEERAAAERVTLDSPNDPDSWLTAGYTLSSIGQDLRQCRIAGDLSPKEWGFLRHIYGLWEGDTLEATRLDPKHGHAWIDLAQAATFAGDDTRAVDAFWQAQALDQNKAEVYSWGLQMFQQKWGGDPATLDKVAALAAAQAYDDSNDAADVAGNLKSAAIGSAGPKYNAMADQIMARIVTNDRSQVAKQPNDAFAHWDLAGALAYQKDRSSLREATLQYRFAAHLLPNAAQVHYWLADTLDQRGKKAEEIPELRRAVALDPFYAKAHFDLGYALKYERKFPEALSELNLAMRLDPRDANAHYGLGDLLLLQNRPLLAAAQYEEAVRLTPYFPEAWNSLCRTLDQTKRYDESLSAGREAIHVDSLGNQPNPEFEDDVYDTMADDYLNKKEWSDSLAETQQAISYNAADPVAQENLAEAYWGEGKQAEARAQWERVIALGDPRLTPVASKLLASHPAQ